MRYLNRKGRRERKEKKIVKNFAPLAFFAVFLLLLQIGCKNNGRATPTSLVVAPWDETVLLVALWLRGEVTGVQIQEEDGRFTGKNTSFITGIANPQHLLPTPDGALLVSDYRTGNIYRITSDSR